MSTTLHEQINYQSDVLKQLKMRSFKDKRQQLANKIGKVGCNIVMAIVMFIMLPLLPIFAFIFFIRKTIDLIKAFFSSYD